MLISFGAWEDIHGYQALLGSRHLAYHEKMKAREHFYEDPLTGNAIVATFPTAFFVLAVNHQEEDYSKATAPRRVENMHKRRTA